MMMSVQTLGLAVPRAKGFMEAREVGNERRNTTSPSPSSSSSIGRNSDVSSERSMDENRENEAESKYNEPLHAMPTLEEVLPIRRGISKFYNGKSKSFTSLADAASMPSTKEIVKPENAYTRRRRNLMAFNHVWDKNKSSLLRSNSSGITKRTISNSRSSVALAFAFNMNNSDSSSSITSEDSSSSSNSSSPLHLPPLHPRNRVPSSGIASLSPSPKNFSRWRSFSLADIHHCAITASVKITSPSLGDGRTHQ